jgi:quercetin dioxygenase-like cupin family protein
VEFARGRAGEPTANGPAGHGDGILTGKMMLDKMLTGDGVAVNTAFFEPGSRTHWHSHSVGQLFLIEHGRGAVSTRDTVQVVEAGDIVYAPAGEEHWHGAAPDSFLVYVAISLGQTSWLEPVCDDRYCTAFA